ncbi:MAG: phosphoribosyltransferase, partial [Oscillospiraceae bacterium]|nr:phosphoribosyltransferase [Oscillospiraceae bacterium]
PLHRLRIRRDIDPNELEHIFIIDDELTTGNTVKALAEKIAAKYPVPISAHAFAASRESVIALGNIGVEVYAKYTYDAIKNAVFPEMFSPDEPERSVTPDGCIDLNSLYDIRHGAHCDKYFKECERLCGTIAEKLKSVLPHVKSVEIIGTEELCLPPIVLGNMLAKRGFEIRVHGVTRSPILPSNAADYSIKTRSVLRSLYDDGRTVYLYNKVECDLTILMTDAVRVDHGDMQRLCGACGGDNIWVVHWRGRAMRTSFKGNDCKLLLKDVTGLISPMNAEERAKQLRSGVHYCELLPEEYEPSAEYIKLYEAGLAAWGRQTALAVRSVSEQILRTKGRGVVIVSLARAGTPIGVLIKRYLKRVHGISSAHYSISIIRGRGIDKAALEYILARHNAKSIQFVDGWTGKGAITRQLAEALADYPEIDCRPAVLADPAGVCEIYGTREDVFIPCSCLNSVVSGLFSRTVLRGDLIADGDFHGAAYFGELAAHDRTYEFIDAVEREMTDLPPYSPAQCDSPNGTGLDETQRIAEEFNVDDINLVKPSIGEATRVLLRRTPKVILLRDIDSPLTKHLTELACEKNVPVREYPLKCYRAAGIIE